MTRRQIRFHAKSSASHVMLFLKHQLRLKCFNSTNTYHANTTEQETGILSVSAFTGFPNWYRHRSLAHATSVTKRIEEATESSPESKERRRENCAGLGPPPLPGGTAQKTGRVMAELKYDPLFTLMEKSKGKSRFIEAGRVFSDVPKEGMKYKNMLGPCVK
ncbi:hypothetical protein NDU88_005068 [Pleurodeles waltl]|uniref:Uncharacterized protein n=1 Tax=Pleurodeles waltl TaxID=8319 RepID=A0AAV7MBU6_PLEWA|nr:hypothetical protein NDU88_005068 [Pleurodeles waltl]